MFSAQQTEKLIVFLGNEFHIIYQMSQSNWKLIEGGAVGWDTALQAGRSRVLFPMVSLEFFIDIILPAAQCPWGDSASNRNEYQEYFLGGKAAGA